MHIVFADSDLNIRLRSPDTYSVENSEGKITVLPLASIESITMQLSENIPVHFLLALFKQGIAVTFLDDKATPLAHAMSLKSGAKASLWRRQLEAVRGDLAVALALQWISIQQHARVALLQQFDQQNAGELARLASANAQEISLGYSREILANAQEARVSKLYWSSFGSLLPPEANWQGRQQRPPDNVINALLNYGYGIAYSVVRAAVRKSGLHPGLGIIHSEARGQDALVFDLVEILRPLIEYAVVQLSLKHPEWIQIENDQKLVTLPGYVRKDLAQAILAELDSNTLELYQEKSAKESLYQALKKFKALVQETPRLRF